MNRYPLWKNLLIGLIFLFGIVYSLPNLFGETPAVLITSGKSTVKLTDAVRQQAANAIAGAGLTPTQSSFEPSAVKFRFKSTDDQFKAKEVVQKALKAEGDDADYVVTLGLLSSNPAWLSSALARPMYLGLDLRGGVHFLMQVDMKAAITKKVESLTADVRSILLDKRIRASASRSGDAIEIRFNSAEDREKARGAILDRAPELALEPLEGAGEFRLTGRLKPDAVEATKQAVLNQNMTTLNKRVNELGVTEPVIQQQGLDRLIVQLPGVQNPEVARRVIGRTATLEMRMVCDDPKEISELEKGIVPLGCEKFFERNRRGAMEPVAVKRDVVFTGDNLTGAISRPDQNGMPAVNLTLDSRATQTFRKVSGENIGRRMAIILFEKGKGEVLTSPVIRSEIPNGDVQISGAMSADEAAETALLLRAGSLAAPMEIIEERTIGPSLGAENIKKGLNSVLYGFAGIAIFMCIYYMLFGLFSTIALAVNVLLLVAILSLMQATLTLPGFAAIALTLGMAIDANVLINERIREELRLGKSGALAIKEGYDRAWDTIFDSNITTLIAGLALLVFGSGAIRGFAVVHCLGILTSMVSAVFVSRGIVNWWYSRQKKVESVSIGTVWKPGLASNR